MPSGTWSQVPLGTRDLLAFEALLNAAAEQIGELLYRRRRLQIALAEDNLLHRLLTFTGEQAGYSGPGPHGGPAGAASKAQRAALCRYRRADHLLRPLRPGARDQRSDAQPPAAARANGVCRMTVVDLVAVLTGQGLPFARRCFRQLLHDRRSLALATQSNDRPGQLPAPPTPAPSDKDEATDPAPFQLSGVVCELLDRTAFGATVPPQGTDGRPGRRAASQ